MSDDQGTQEDGEARQAWGRLEPFARASFRAELEDFFKEGDTDTGGKDGGSADTGGGGAGSDAAGDTGGGGAGGSGGGAKKAPAKAQGQEAGFDLSGFLFGKSAKK